MSSHLGQGHVPASGIAPFWHDFEVRIGEMSQPGCGQLLRPPTNGRRSTSEEALPWGHHDANSTPGKTAPIALAPIQHARYASGYWPDN